MNATIEQTATVTEKTICWAIVNESKEILAAICGPGAERKARQDSAAMEVRRMTVAEYIRKTGGQSGLVALKMSFAKA